MAALGRYDDASLAQSPPRFPWGAAARFQLLPPGSRTPSSPRLVALRAPAAGELIHAARACSLRKGRKRLPAAGVGLPCVDCLLVPELFRAGSIGSAWFTSKTVIRDSIQLNFGACSLAASLGALQVKYVNPLTKLCIIRVSREEHQKVWAAITMVRSIGKIPISFNLLDVSGTIRACRKAALECDEAKFEQYKLAAGDRISPEIIQSAQSCFDRIRGLES